MYRQRVFVWSGWETLPRCAQRALLVTFACLLAGIAPAATLAVGTASGSVGGNVSLPLTLTPGTGQAVAAIQCDVNFPSALTLSTAVAGPTATAAGKTVSTYTLGVGHVRLIIAGFNQTAIAAGTAATLQFGVAAGANGALAVTLSSAVLANASGQSVAVTTSNGGVNVSTTTAVHSGDPNNDGKIALTELLRIIQFYNLGGYACAAATEDAFTPGEGDRTCTPHSADYAPQNWKIGLTEVLRVIQFYNAKGYVADVTGEDGFRPLF